MSVDGIDVSHYQGTINWVQVLADPRIRVIVVKATQGTTYVDPMFRQHQTRLRQLVPIPQGIPGAPWLGWYHFRENVLPSTQAAHFRATVGTLRPGELVAVDCEGDTTGTLLDQQAILSSTAAAFGRNPLLYGGDNPGPSGYDRWIARYRARPPNFNCVLWQFGGAVVAGIARPCDANTIMDAEGLARACGLGYEEDDDMWTDAEKARLLAGADAAVALERRWDPSGRTKLDDIWTQLKAQDHADTVAGMVKELVDGTKP